MSGRRAAFGVALKNARRNKKRTFYLVALIAVPVMVAVVTSAVVRLSYVSPEEQATSDFGQANVLMEQYGTTPELDAWIDAEIAQLAPDAERLEYRADYATFAPREWGRVVDVDLDNPLSDGTLTLVAGRSPSAADEVVLTEHLAGVLEAGIGDTVHLDISGDSSIPGNQMFEVVGVASHPILWNVNDAVVAPDGLDRYSDREPGFGHYLLLSVDDDVAFNARYSQDWDRQRYSFYPDDREWPMPERYFFLPEEYYAAMTSDELAELDRIIDEEGDDPAQSYVYNSLFSNGVSESLPSTYAQTKSERLMWTQTSVVETGPVIGTGVAALILAEVAFIAGAAFATGTRRRLREIGLMGANGASTKHVRSTVVGEGLVVGLVGGVAGSVIAFLLITVGRPVVQQFVARRIDGFPFSVLDVVGPILVAVIACAVAAWVPARTASSVPTLTALQGRMPVGAPKRWIIPLGLALAGLGALFLAVGLAGGSTGAGAVAVIGSVLMIGGTALLAGPLVAWISKHAERFPITSRIVLRDSGRQRGRAAAAVAATMVILMAPVGVLVTLEQSEANQAVNGLSLASPQVVVEGTHDDQGDTQPLTEDALSAVAGVLPDARIASFAAIDVPIKYPAEVAALAEDQQQADGQFYINPWRMGVANDELFALLDSEALESVLGRDGIALIGIEARTSTVEIGGEEISVAEVPLAVQRWSFPRVIVTEEIAASYVDFETRDEALIEVDQTWLQAVNPFQDTMQPLWEAGLGLELSGGGDDLGGGAVFAMIFLATMAIVLIVVATITALSAAEADNDLRTVVAVGATNSIRRRYLGLQSGIHTLLGCVLAVPLTLLVMWTAYSSNFGYRQVGYFGVFDSSDLFVPWAGIAGLVIGLPLAIGLITTMMVRSAPTTPPRRAT